MNEITIDGKVYQAHELTDQQKIWVDHVVNLSQQMNALKFQLDQLQGGHLYFMGQLKESLK